MSEAAAPLHGVNEQRRVTPVLELFGRDPEVDPLFRLSRWSDVEPAEEHVLIGGDELPRRLPHL